MDRRAGERERHARRIPRSACACHGQGPAQHDQRLRDLDRGRMQRHRGRHRPHRRDAGVPGSVEAQGARHPRRTCCGAGAQRGTRHQPFLPRPMELRRVRMGAPVPLAGAHHAGRPGGLARLVARAAVTGAGGCAVNAPAVGMFALRALLWLPPCFALWFFAAPYQASIAGGFAHLWLALLAPGLVTTLERSGSTLAFVTTLQVPSAPGQQAVLAPEVGALIYTYGTALLIALMLAARARASKMLAAAALLLPFQGWGLAFDFLAQVGIGLGPDIAAQAGLADWRREAIALGYQIGSVILPTLAPVMLCAIFCGSFFELVVRGHRRVPLTPAGGAATAPDL